MWRLLRTRMAPGVPKRASARSVVGLNRRARVCPWPATTPGLHEGWIVAQLREFCFDKGPDRGYLPE